MTAGDVRGQIADQAREVGRGWSGRDADPDWALVAALFECVAHDEELLRLAAEIPLDRSPALLLVASIQRTVADHPDHPLAAYYPRPDQRTVDDAFPHVLRDFAVDHQDEVRRWFDRRYQMNEVGRCVQTALALGVVAQWAPGRRMALIDVGTGAGLGLHLDRYHVDLGRGRTFGPPDSPVQLTCAVVGDPPLPPGAPEIAERIGIDAAPIDLGDADSVAWLSACTPPTSDALERLGGAVAVTRAAGAPIVEGDGAQRLGAVIDTIPDDLLVVVVDSYTAVFMDDGARRAMGDVVMGRDRDAAWISLDPLVPLGTAAERCVQDLPVDHELIEANRAGGVFAMLSVVASIGARRAAEVLATAHPSGTRMAWRGGVLPISASPPHPYFGR